MLFDILSQLIHLFLHVSYQLSSHLLLLFSSFGYFGALFLNYYFFDYFLGLLLLRSRGGLSFVGGFANILAVLLDYCHQIDLQLSILLVYEALFVQELVQVVLFETYWRVYKFFFVPQVGIFINFMQLNDLKIGFFVLFDKEMPRQIVEKVLEGDRHWL